MKKTLIAFVLAFAGILFVPFSIAESNFIENTAKDKKLEVKGFSVGSLVYLRYPIPGFLAPALHEMGIDNVATHHTNYPDMSLGSMLKRARLYREFCEKENFKYRVLIAYSEFPDELFYEFKGSKLFEGVQLQEAPWGKVIRGDTRKNKRIEPFAKLMPTMTLTEALDAIEKGMTLEVKRYRNLGCDVSSTNVFPVMMHSLAKSKFTVCPKFLKESFTPLIHAIAWGAAIQYDVDLWADGDLWCLQQRPGHSALELKSNMLYAYWTGVSRFMIEGAGGGVTDSSDSSAPRFKVSATREWIDFDGLVDYDGENWQLNERGQVVRDFVKKYIPNNPRYHSYKDVLPDIAIVRFPDAQCGIITWNDVEWHKRAFGNNLSPILPEESKEVLEIWNLLTHGKTEGHMCLFTKHGKSEFFFPLNGVVVFDHRVSYEKLKDIPLIILTGPIVNPQTLQDISRCVEQGAVCLSSYKLAPEMITSKVDRSVDINEVAHGKGKWLLTNNFDEKELKAKLAPLLGSPDEIRYRFKNNIEVIFRMKNKNPNDIKVFVKNRIAPVE
jgi:hypothetical protein